MFNRNTSALIFDAYVAAERGDASGLALMSVAYDLFVPKSFIWDDFFAQGGSADQDLSRDYTEDLNAPDSIMGSPISLLAWAPLSKAWPGNHGFPTTRQVDLSEVDAPFIGGSIDFSTPAEYATSELLPYLKNARQVIPEEMGHVGDIWNVQPEATTRSLVNFCNTSKMDASIYEYQPMNFRVKFGFPVLAKILLAVGILPVLGLIQSFRRFRLQNKGRHPARKACRQDSETNITHGSAR